MNSYEYTVVPAPAKGVKAKGVKTPEARFALALEQLMNQMGAQGWQYQRAETLPSVERSGFTGSTTNWRHVLVFRRPLTQPQAHQTPFEDMTPSEPPLTAAVAAAGAGAGVAIAEPQLRADEAYAEDAPAYDPERPGGQPGATQMLPDNGVEETSEVAGMTSSLESLAETRKSSDNSDA